jgi:Na+-translocating ferredoxin:NAD+ oxidoreductase RnfD subunit
MKATETISTLNYYPNRDPRRRYFALWYFTILLIGWTILGHAALGFEQSWAHPVVGVATAIFMQVLLTRIDAWATYRELRYRGRFSFINSLPPAIIPGLACAMLVYPNDRLAPVAFAAALSIASKVFFRAPIGDGKTQHIFNPSNLGITVTLFLMPWVGLAPAYHFTQNITGVWNWVIPGIILLTGIIVHALFTGRLPLCLAWVGGFALQAVIRGLFFGASWVAAIAPVTSVAFVIFTLFMIPDPATTPIKPRRQAAFGLAVALVYGLLQIFHVVFGLFISLAIISALRGIYLHIYGVWKPGWVAGPQYIKQDPLAAGGD